MPVETVTDCRDLDASLRFFVEQLGWRIHLVTPADDPVAYVVEHPASGGRLRLRRSAADVPVELTLVGDRRERRVGPNGTIVEVVPDPVAGAVGAEMAVPASVPSLHVSAPGGDTAVGRAGMTYRDLLPDRWGGRFVASHIRIDHADGGDGDVADWVHYHRIRFQLIYVMSGWVDVVYEDQGEPFRMHVGDCVLQPPEIRHRVLRSSSGLEVIEVGCPAVHDTVSDPDMSLPNGLGPADRSFAGQRFVRHIAERAPRGPWSVSGWSARDTGLGAATDGLVGAVVVGPDPHGSSADAAPTWLTHDQEFALVVGVRGEAVVDLDGREPVRLVAGASIALPPGVRWRTTGAGADHEQLVISLSSSAIAPA